MGRGEVERRLAEWVIYAGIGLLEGCLVEVGEIGERCEMRIVTVEAVRGSLMAVVDEGGRLQGVLQRKM